jgi:hypothetical protein
VPRLSFCLSALELSLPLVSDGLPPVLACCRGALGASQRLIQCTVDLSAFGPKTKVRAKTATPCRLSTRNHPQLGRSAHAAARQTDFCSKGANHQVVCEPCESLRLDLPRPLCGSWISRTTTLHLWWCTRCGTALLGTGRGETRDDEGAARDGILDPRCAVRPSAAQQGGWPAKP